MKQTKDQIFHKAFVYTIYFNKHLFKTYSLPMQLSASLSFPWIKFILETNTSFQATEREND